MGNSKKKKNKSGSSKKDDSVFVGNGSDKRVEQGVINSLVETFSLVSVEDANASCEDANDDRNRAVDISSGLSDNADVHTTCSSSSVSSGLGSSSCEGFRDSNCGDNAANYWDFRVSRRKKFVASTGTVSTVLGKDYVTASSRTGLMKQSGLSNGRSDLEEAEQFLCSMLGDDCGLGMAVVKDVLCNCGYNIGKALDVLLDLSASTCELCPSHRFSSFGASSREDGKLITCSDILRDGGSYSTSHLSENEVQDNMQGLNNGCRSYLGALVTSGSSNQTSSTSERREELELPQKLLESLFNIPECSEHDPRTMNWRNAIKNVESYVQKQLELSSSGSAGLPMNDYEKGAEYQVFRETARDHWNSVKTYYQKAATAYSNGERVYAAHLSEQGKLCSKLARKEDEKASMEIFKARNKGIENTLTFDLHGQHVKEAIRLVKLHLLFGTFISSVQYLRVITGSGTQGVGKSKLKESVINLLEREGIEWKEENRGSVLIKLDGAREFSFLNSGSDSD
ncbi:hypothetical protein Nepgr_014559 [Nepenthes gracilis]|uniref:Smr domain-containing protein n=1 Tax=Nepenthes gracilis TaxID=150966 RepID=A0AAD3XPZ1_NEPGR|nr:hypothetical protein Nepgr_014559 [Nepenthes gracilis]